MVLGPVRVIGAGVVLIVFVEVNLLNAYNYLVYRIVFTYLFICKIIMFTQVTKGGRHNLSTRLFCMHIILLETLS